MVIHYQSHQIDTTQINPKTIKITPWMVVFNMKDKQGWTIPHEYLGEEELSHLINICKK